MYVQIEVEIGKHEDGTYDVFLSHNGSSGCSYDRESLEEIGDCIKDYVMCLQDEEFANEEEEDDE